MNPDYQRMGIGKQIMDAAIKAFPNGRKLRLGVIENNPKGFPFYMKQGFQISGKEIEQLNSGAITVLILEKDIESR